MRAVIVPEPGGPDALVVADLPDPSRGPGEVVIDVAATAVNRADTLQRQGFYPPPPGASDVLGLECSGTVSAVGDGVDGWSVGDEVCALLASGGYAEQGGRAGRPGDAGAGGRRPGHRGGAARGRGTVWSNVFMIAGLQPGETFLVHGGAGGIGTMAIQLAKALGAAGGATAGSAEKLAAVPGAGGRRRGQLPRAGLRRGGSGSAGRRGRDPRQHGRVVPRCATWRRSRPRAGWS